MEHEYVQDTPEIDLALIKKLVDTWPRRATVRTREYDVFTESIYDETRPDYPHQMIPFWHHPRFEVVPEEVKQHVLSWAWLVYNERTISAEENVANPAFALLMKGHFPGTNHINVQKAIQQSLVDEHFHTLMHMTAINKTKELRQLDYEIRFPHSITYRRLLEAQDQVPETWEKNLLTLSFAVVSEISINAYLELLARNKAVQPMHSLIAKLHNRDEYAHSSLLIEISKLLYVNMTRAERKKFLQALPKALDAFVAQDYSSWECILRHFKIKDATYILEDCKMNPGGKNLVRDYSGLRKLAQELDIMRELHFDFSKTG